MAIGLFKKGSRTVDNDTSDLDRKPSPQSGSGSGSFGGYDPESHDEKGRKMSRIAGPGAVTTDEEKLDVGKQLELESTNSIKYRTCSWQKVNQRAPLSFPSRQGGDSSPA